MTIANNIFSLKRIRQALNGDSIFKTKTSKESKKLHTNLSRINEENKVSTNELIYKGS